MSVTWLTHAQLEQLDPGALKHERQLDEQRKKNLGDRYTPLREFPCPGTFTAATNPAAGMTLYVCDVCGYDVGVPAGFADSDAARQWFIERSHLPERHVEAVDKGIIQDEGNRRARAELRAWSDAYVLGQVSTPPLLVGSVGTGKTLLLVEACLNVLEKVNRPIRYWPLAELLEQQKQSFNTDNVPPVEIAKSMDVLVLDDLGAERDTDYGTDLLGQIIDARYRSGKPTLAATNVLPSQWAEVFGDRTASRLVELTAPVRVDGPDRRLA